MKWLYLFTVVALFCIAKNSHAQQTISYYVSPSLSYGENDVLIIPAGVSYSFIGRDFPLGVFLNVGTNPFVVGNKGFRRFECYGGLGYRPLNQNAIFYLGAGKRLNNYYDRDESGYVIISNEWNSQWLLFSSIGFVFKSYVFSTGVNYAIQSYYSNDWNLVLSLGIKL